MAGNPDACSTWAERRTGNGRSYIGLGTGSPLGPPDIRPSRAGRDRCSPETAGTPAARPSGWRKMAS